VVIPRGVKDTFNSLEPTGDAAALTFVTDPEAAQAAAGALRHSVAADAAQRPRHDLPDRHSRPESTPGSTPSEMLRLNVAIPPTQSESAWRARR
jgi:hypothetical protein